MKIVILADDFPPRSLGGAGFSTYKLALGLHEAGQDVSVITVSPDGKDVGKTEYNGLHVYTLQNAYHLRWRAYKSLYNSVLVPKIEQILKEIQPDIVHANNIHTHLSYHSLALGKKYAKAVVWTARDVMSFNYGKLKTRRYLDHLDYRTNWIDHIKLARKRWNPFRNFIIRKYLRLVDGRFAVSYALKEALFQNGIKNVEVIHTGADVDLWNVTPEEEARYREKFKITGKKVILFGGRLSGAKGGDKAIAALERVVKKVPNAVLLVAGKTDEYAREMQENATKVGLQNKLIFSGWIAENEMKYAYACADVVLVPSSVFDSLPRLIIEAMASGRAVVGTCYGGTPEVVDDGRTGYIVNPHNIDMMAEKIIELLTDEQKAERFGKAAHDKIKEKLNRGDMIKKYLDAYTRLIKEKYGN